MAPRGAIGAEPERRPAVEIAKIEVLKLVDEMPEHVGLEELQYRLYLRQKLEAAEEDVRAGRTFSHEEVVQETAQWFEELSGPARRDRATL